MISPFLGVNFIALLKRFVTTCCNLVESPKTEYGRLLSGQYKKSISFSFAAIANNSTICSKNISKTNFSFTISNFPLSIFEISNTSFIIFKRDFALLEIICAFSLSSFFISDSHKTSEKPIIAFNGVLIS